MGSMKNGNIKKSVEAIEKQERNMKTLLEQAKSQCNHTKNGDLDIVPANNRQQGELKYICRKCKKTLDLRKIPEDELRGSCDCIDRAIDVVKLQLDPNKEADAEILKRVAKVQYRVRNDIIKLYAASLKKNRGNNKNSSNYNNDSSWNKPTVM